MRLDEFWYVYWLLQIMQLADYYPNTIRQPSVCLRDYQLRNYQRYRVGIWNDPFDMINLQVSVALW